MSASLRTWGERIVLIVVCWGRMAARLARIELASSLQIRGTFQRRVCMQVGACCVSDLAFLLKGLSFSRSEGPRMANVTHMGLCSSAESVPG